MMDEQLKAQFITQYSNDNWPIYKSMVLVYPDVIDAAVFLSGPSEPPEDTALPTKSKLISASNF